MDLETKRYVDWIKANLARKPGKTQSGLAAHLGIAHPQITQLLKGNRELKVREINPIAEYFDTSPPARSFPLVGDVGAGGDIVAIDWPGGEPEFVDGPSDAPIGTVAARIRGESLGPQFENWLAFYNDRRTPFEPDWLGQLCVVGTDDGRTLIKWIRSGADGFNLVSGTGAIEENVRLTWAARVITLRPPY